MFHVCEKVMLFGITMNFYYIKKMRILYIMFTNKRIEMQNITSVSQILLPAKIPPNLT